MMMRVKIVAQVRVEHAPCLACGWHVGLWPRYLEALSAPKEAAVLKHVSAVRVQRPKAAFARLVWPPWDLNEAVVEGEVVAQRVLPALRVLAVVGEALHDELVDVAQGEHLLRRVLDGHCRQGDIRVRGLLVTVGALARTRHGTFPPPLWLHRLKGPHTTKIQRIASGRSAGSRPLLFKT